LITIKTTKIPKKFDDVSFNLKNYQIQQIDENTNTVKWVLKSEAAQASSDESKAIITKPKLLFFDAGQPQFTIEAEKAALNKADQKVLLEEKVYLVSSDDKLKIHAGKMIFSEHDDYIRFSENWQIEDDSGFDISGLLGSLSKDQKHIISQKNARLVKKDQERDLTIDADLIHLEPKAVIPVKADGSATMLISATQRLNASHLEIKKDGELNASGNVSITTDKLICHSQKLKVIPRPDKNPQTAVFTGNPFIIQNKQTIYADTITYNFDTGLAQIEGHVHSGP